MENKLELKHLAPYLPYRVKVGYVHYLHAGNGIGSVSHMLTTNSDLYKLKLRPLSQLTEPIEVNGVEIVPMVELLKIKYSEWYEAKKGTRYAKIDYDNNSAWFSNHAPFEIRINYFFYDIFSYPPHWIVEKLAEWHFDFQGLIEKGLADPIVNQLNETK